MNPLGYHSTQGTQNMTGGDPHRIWSIMKQILLLSGYARSGKDSVANLLEEEKGYRRFAFADALKEMVASAMGFPVELFHSRQKDSLVPGSSKTYRDFLLETARVERARDLDVFSRIVSKDILAADTNRVVITDWRYKREESFLRSFFDPAAYQIIRGRVVRPDIIPLPDETEHDLDGEPMDVVIENNGSLASLRDAVHAAFSLCHPSS